MTKKSRTHPLLNSEVPQAVNYPEIMIAQGKRSYDNLSSRGKLSVIWSLRIHLNSISFDTNCYREWILNIFTYFWCFLELFIVKFIQNIDNEHKQDYSCPRATFLFTWRKVTSARRVTRCCATGNPLLEVAPRQQKTHVNSCRRQTVYQGNVDPGISEVPPIRDSMNRPWQGQTCSSL